jgi:hypothetical protein
MTSIWCLLFLQESRLEERTKKKKKQGQVSGLKVASWSFVGHPFHSSIHSSATMQGSSSPEQGFPSNKVFCNPSQPFILYWILVAMNSFNSSLSPSTPPFSLDSSLGLGSSLSPSNGPSPLDSSLPPLAPLHVRRC